MSCSPENKWDVVLLFAMLEWLASVQIPAGCVFRVITSAVPKCLLKPCGCFAVNERGEQGPVCYFMGQSGENKLKCLF